jgi:hypothetical protein
VPVSVLKRSIADMRPMPEFRVFLSAVSSEFRNALTDDLGTRDVLVRVQEQFPPDRKVRTLQGSALVWKPQE